MSVKILVNAVDPEECRVATVKKNKLEKARILNMSEHELCQYWLTRTNYDNDKYVWRNIGMSNLSPFRVRKDGTVRSGGTQGNYKDVLNTIAAEYLFGDPVYHRGD